MTSTPPPTPTPTTTSTPVMSPTPTTPSSPLSTSTPLPTPQATPPPVSATEVQAFLWPAEMVVKAGDVLEVSVWVNPGRVGVSGGEIRVFFPSQVFEVVDIQPGALLGSNALIGYQEVNNPGGFAQLALARVGSTPVPSPPGPFALLKLLSKSTTSPGVYTLSLRVGLADERFQDVALASVKGGRVTVEIP